MRHLLASRACGTFLVPSVQSARQRQPFASREIWSLAPGSRTSPASGESGVGLIVWSWSWSNLIEEEVTRLLMVNVVGAPNCGGGTRSSPRSSPAGRSPGSSSTRWRSREVGSNELNQIYKIAFSRNLNCTNFCTVNAIPFVNCPKTVLHPITLYADHRHGGPG